MPDCPLCDAQFPPSNRSFLQGYDTVTGKPIVLVLPEDVYKELSELPKLSLWERVKGWCLRVFGKLGR